MLNVITDADSKSKVSTHLGKSILCFLAILISLVFFVSDKVNAQAPDWQWAKGIGGTGDDRGGSIAVDDSGNIYTTGNFNGTVDFDPGVGVFNLTSAGSYDIFISKFDSLGNFVWAIRMGGTGDDGTDWVAGRCIVLDASGNIYTTGYFSGTADFDPSPSVYNLTSAGSIDIYVAKVGNQGNFIWARKMGGTAQDLANSIALDANNNVYTSGRFAGTSDFDPGPGLYNLTQSGVWFDIFISKLDNAGNFVWAKHIGSTNYEQALDMRSDGSGNICITGGFTAPLILILM
ncbi:MAG: SBBP repeat-containing protein [Bacteroidetes bacterium]|nr:SBBP repeat-containing protein [Bacteroidota bacterium]